MPLSLQTALSMSQEGSFSNKIHLAFRKLMKHIKHSEEYKIILYFTHPFLLVERRRNCIHITGLYQTQHWRRSGFSSTMWTKRIWIIKKIFVAKMKLYLFSFIHVKNLQKFYEMNRILCMSIKLIGFGRTSKTTIDSILHNFRNKITFRYKY